MNEDAIHTLNDLIHLDADAIRAYQQAIAACQSPVVKQRLTEFMGDHERHVVELGGAVRSLGGVPVEAKQDIKGFFIEGFTAIMSHGDRSALMAMRGNEELTTRRYEAARKANVTGDALLVIDKNYQDEVRHLSWIKEAIDKKVWEAGRDRAA